MGGGTAGAAVKVVADSGGTKAEVFNFEISGADEGVSVKFAAASGGGLALQIGDTAERSLQSSRIGCIWTRSF